MHGQFNGGNYGHGETQMNTDNSDAKYKELTSKIIEIFYKVYNKVIVEIKAAKNLAVENEAQLLNYLKASDIEVGLLLNFGSKPEIKRKVFDNIRK